MSFDNPKGIGSSVSKNTTQRRTFLKKATAGAVIASIPGRSAWAGIAGSIVASGHGSDFNQGESTVLLDACAFNTSTYRSMRFSAIFNGNPFNAGGGIRSRNGVDDAGDLTIGMIFDAHFNPSASDAPPQLGHYRGVNRVNVGLIVIYLNAINDGNFGITYPVLSQHGTSADFADYLYRAASADAASTGALLDHTISTYSGSTFSVPGAC
ncbi:hypothetical protein [uncultured Paraglaciecola sp.]|uniref:hypothetical protein n=1 Tax=uncultured Paraglaciecola sp. TaxID=1765024 RepID=UPI0025DB6F5D|nr:hypothetical protein [uncultured Paraglaciecola sp.]